MNHVGVFPRLRDVPHQRRKRGAALASAGNQSCVEVQWRFLPPRSTASPPGKLRRAADRSAAASGGGKIDYFSYQDQCGSGEQSRMLDVLTGEAQRQAALDRIMAEMHDLVVQPLTPPKSPSDSASPAREARKRSSALLETFKLAEGPGSGVSLLPQRKRSTLGIIADAHARSTNEDEDDDDGEARSGQGTGADSVLARAAAANAASSAEPPRRRWKCADTADDLEPQFVWQQSATARFAADLPRRLAPTARLKKDGSPRPPSAGAASRPAHAPYGAWYVPRHHWWPLRQLEQQAAADTDTSDRDLDPSPPSLSASRDHCHRGAQRQHKPPLPPSAASPRGSSRSDRRPPPPSLPSPLLPSEPSASGSVSALAGAVGTQVQLADSYIGREYRSFITRRGGSPLPHYLK